MRKLSFLILGLSVLFISCTKITDEDISREVAINVGNCVQRAISENVPPDIVGELHTSKSWNGGTVEINGDFAGSDVGDYTIKFTNVVFEYTHKDGKKEWNSKITHNGTLTVSQSGSIINAKGNSYSTSGTVKLKKKSKTHNGSGAISVKLTGGSGGNTATVYGVSASF